MEKQANILDENINAIIKRIERILGKGKYNLKTCEV